MDYNLGKRDLGNLLRQLRQGSTLKLSWATRITLMRILLVVPFIGLMVNTHDPQLAASTQELLRRLAAGVFFVMAATDAVDGYLARHRRQITRLGTFLDPLADKLLITSATILLASAGTCVRGFPLPMTVVVLIIGKDVLIVIGFIVLYLITSQIHIVPVWAGKLATAVQLVMVAAVLVGPELAQVIPGYRGFVHVLWWVAGGSAVLAALIYIYHGSRYIEHYEQTQGKVGN
jgi:CDP-diacylglycerol--glycerol-3-phosphate 3-phosphatidyltransferase